LYLCIGKINPMRDNLAYIVKELSPVEGCVAFHSHGILSTNPKQGSFITYFLSRLIISSQIEKVLIVVWGEISKSVQRVYDFST